MAKRPHESSQFKSRRGRGASPYIIKTTHSKLPLSSQKWKSTTSHHAPGFWDLLKAKGISLSLNRHTLQEFDRRNEFQDQGQNPVEVRAEQGLETPIASTALKRFARLGGPDLSDVKGYPEPEPIETISGRAGRGSGRVGKVSQHVTHESSRVTKSTSKKPKSSRSSAYKSDFMKLLVAEHVDRTRRTGKPANYDLLRSQLEQPRRSLSPTRFSESQYEDFLDAVDHAFEEAQVMTDVFSVIKGTKSRPSRTNHSCKNWVPLISADLVIPQPDFFDGAEQNPANEKIRQALDGVIVPSYACDIPFLPNFFAEVKPPHASAEVARRQIIYDGAFGARAMHHLRAYGASESFDENAYTLTATYTDRRLEIFCHHLTAPDGPGKLPHYHTVSLARRILDGSVGDFRAGVSAFRNARDIAQAVRDTSLAEANQRMHACSQRD